jgi:hypothetical protein
MITLRCTRRAADALGVRLLDDPAPGTSPLGDWYVNLVPTAAGELFLFMNEPSLLIVIVPRGETPVLQAFVARVGNVLSMIGLANGRVEEELGDFAETRAGKTQSKRLLGVMNDLAARLQEAIDAAGPRKKMSLSNFESKMANMPHATLGFRTASEAAWELLRAGT